MRLACLGLGIALLSACVSRNELTDAEILSLLEHFEQQSRQIEQERGAARRRGIRELVVHERSRPVAERAVTADLDGAQVAAVIDELGIGYVLSDIPSLTGRVTAKFERLPMPEALAAILNPAQLRATIGPKGIVISRLPQVSLELNAIDDYVFAKRVLRYADTRNLEPILPLLLGEHSDDDDDDDDEGEFDLGSDQSGSQTVSSPSKSLIFAPIHFENAIVLKGPSRDVENALRLLDAVDTDVGHVMIEAVVLEFSAGELLEIGSRLSDGAKGAYSDVSIDWASLIGETIAFTRLEGADNARTFRAAISLLLENNFARVVARPYLAAISGEQARMEVAEDRYVTTFTQNVGEVTLEPVTSGVVMEMTPFVLPDERIRMDLNVSVSQFVPTVNNVALARRRSNASSIMRIGAGETLVIGGLMAGQSARSNIGVPGIRAIPGLGMLFGTQQKSDEQRRLLIYITPYIWEPGTETPMRNRQELRRFIERQDGFSSGAREETGPADPDRLTGRADPLPDPFGFCARAGTTGMRPGPDDGAQFPPVLLESMAAAGIVSETLPQAVASATRWRCLDGAVLVCPVGANLPCDERADLSTTPSPAMSGFCVANPDAQVIPAYVTGRATVFEWRCDGKTAVAGRQVFTPDREGYLSEFWHQLLPPDAPDAR